MCGAARTKSPSKRPNGCLCRLLIVVPATAEVLRIHPSTKAPTCSDPLPDLQRRPRPWRSSKPTLRPRVLHHRATWRPPLPSLRTTLQSQLRALLHPFPTLICAHGRARGVDGPLSREYDQSTKESNRQVHELPAGSIFGAPYYVRYRTYGPHADLISALMWPQ